MLNLRDFEAFVELAHRLHFQETADRLNISSATLSRIISRVEDNVGTRLFVRTTRSVLLTVAGQAFLDESEQLLRQQKNAMRVGREIGLGVAGSLKLGYGGIAVETFLPGLVTRFKAQFPGVHIDLNLLPITAQEAALMEGELDIGFFCGGTRNSELRCQPCYREPLLLIMAVGHPLAEVDVIHLADLEPFGFVLGKRDKWVSVYDHFLDSCSQQGLDIRVELEADDVASVMGLVAAGEFLSLFPVGNASMQREGIRWRPLIDFNDEVAVNAVWQRANENPALRHLLEGMQL
ncbi:MAG: LysR family transcriptional regulator [Oceanospirillales bacterium]|uniref:LysR family transcriptional regulator n=1 Tax=Marinobacterium halophilum TaxID=267374 RepID=A0A2P8ESW7_9GAMM|nr:LysR family transcriptional regulator [Marinobacterium halophilum]MBR9829157.1 LysR family transcriptional regulator [Oceanospirillales bacterium]PSL12528.1 LysR family transcriptional regulator [Marinobacterium halophilum]